MKVETFLENIGGEESVQIVTKESIWEEEMTKVFCCDLLSVAMGKAPAGGVWVTVIANVNTLAVAALTETACVILAEGANLEEALIEKARQEGVCLLATELPVYEAACLADRYLHG
ncbi:MAG: hypothetical protein Q4B70_01280 [Lachnospiraceae bacterium]|nr:hypothetical protein [Lachnospiraceae bacterium]